MKKVILLFGMLSPLVMGLKSKPSPFSALASKMANITGMEPQIADFERRAGIAQEVEPKLNQAIKTLRQLTDASGLGDDRFVKKNECHKVTIDSDSKCIRVVEKMSRLECFKPFIDDFERRVGIWQQASNESEKISGSIEKIFGTHVTVESNTASFTGVPKISSSEILLKLARKLKNITNTKVKIADFERRLGIAESQSEPKLQESLSGLQGILTLNGRKLDGSHGHGGKTSCIGLLSKMETMKGYQGEIEDIERRVGLVQQLEPKLALFIKLMQKVIDVRGMNPKRRLLRDDSGADFNIVNKWSQQNPGSWSKDFSWDGEKFPTNRSPLQKLSDIHIQIEYLKSGKHMLRSSANHENSWASLRMKEIIARIPEIKRFEKMLKKMAHLDLGLIQPLDTPVNLTLSGPLALAGMSLQKVIDVRRWRKTTRRLPAAGSGLRPDIGVDATQIKGQVAGMVDFERRLKIAMSVEPLLHEILVDLRAVSDMSGMY